jgi:hypothetical protein
MIADRLGVRMNVRWQSGNQSACRLFIVRAGNVRRDEAQQPMSAQAEELIARNLIEALDRLHQELERVELWTAALTCFRHPAPAYQPSDQYMLPPLSQSVPRRPIL